MIAIHANHHELVIGIASATGERRKARAVRAEGP
jgi:hypothetical protein